jgi:hypothetical protein
LHVCEFGEEIATGLGTHAGGFVLLLRCRSS